MAQWDFVASAEYILLVNGYEGWLHRLLIRLTSSKDIRILGKEVGDFFSACIRALAWRIVAVTDRRRMTIIESDGRFACDVVCIMESWSFALGHTPEQREKVLRVLARDFGAWIDSRGSILCFPVGPILKITRENGGAVVAALGQGSP